MTEDLHRAPFGWCDALLVGAGPKALFAVAELDANLAKSPVRRQPLRVVMCDPAQPGAGAVWNQDQPDHLRMNVDAGIVDVTCPSVPETYREWEQRVIPEAAGDMFPPRARIGRYLAWAYSRLEASPRLELTHAPHWIEDVRREGRYWAAVSTLGTVLCRSPAVLMCTGHADFGGPDHHRISGSAGPSAGSHVTIGGAALTAIDVTLDLTEGRGGKWRRLPGGTLEYAASGGEPSRITVTSRSGELMLPKPATDQSSTTEAVKDITTHLTALGDPDDAWWTTIADAAVAAAASSGIDLDRRSIMRFLDAAPPRVPAELHWRRNLARAGGDVDDDPAWWWGRAWAAGYQDVVTSLERSKRSSENWSRWRRRAARLERWAFGPPSSTIEKLHALQVHGLLRHRRVSPHTPFDIGAVTEGPGILTHPRQSPDPTQANSELWSSLLARGHVTVRPLERGVLTASDAVCVNHAGRPTTGLAAIGRPTEDPVIGHDTLNRALHADGRRWARALHDWVQGAAVDAATVPFHEHEWCTR